MKLKTLVFVTLLAGNACALDKSLDIYDFSGGLTDSVSSERMNTKYTPDMCNVSLDEDSGLVMRKEYIKYNTTALSGLQPIRSMYSYNKVDGTKYLIANSSTSVWSSKNGNEFIAVNSTFTLNIRQTFETALDVLYGGNGTDNEWKWDGTTFTDYTVANSTNMVKAKYHCFYQNRMFRAGVSGYPLTVYYSNINTDTAGAPVVDIGDMGNGTNWEYISQAGDQITGLARSQNGGYLYIFTEHSTWALVGTSPTNWRITCINPNIGCLYSSTIDYLNGNMIFLSSRGIEQFDGQNFKLLSSTIDGQIKALSQLNTNMGGSIEQDSAADWGEGTGTNIDTTTYIGSVSLNNLVLVSSNPASSGNISASTFWSRQKYIPSQDIYVSTANLTRYITGTGSGYAFFNTYLKNSSLVSIATATYPNTILTINSKLSANSTYWFYAEPVILAPYNVDYELDIVYTPILLNSTTFYRDRSADGGVTWTPQSSCVGVRLYYSTTTVGSYTTQSCLANNWGSWGSFTTDETKPTDTTISYYAVTSTSVYNLSTNISFPVISGQVINSAVGGYIKIITSFTSINSSTNPKVNKIEIFHYGTNYNIPTGKTYNESYYLSVSTDNSTTINNVVYRYNKNGIFELYNNIYAGSFAEYRGDLLFGSSQNTGQAYKLNIGSSYSDSIGGYIAWYYTPIMDCGNPISPKSYKALWLTSSIDTNAFSLQYSIDGSSTWTSLTPSVVSTKINTQKINFPVGTRGKYIQFKISGTNYFNLRGMSLIYEELPLE